MAINWFPGHMHKARKEIAQTMPRVDLLIELVDARIPYSSANPLVPELRGDKPLLKVLNKVDLADPEMTRIWIEHFEKEDGVKAIPLEARLPHQLKTLLAMGRKMVPKERSAGKPITTMVLGIPNVGKSTLINGLVGRNIAKTGNVPAVTKKQQRIPLAQDFVLLDTPGFLWPKLWPDGCGYRLAITGAIKDAVIDYEDIAFFAASYLSQVYPDRLLSRYKLDALPSETELIINAIAAKRGCIGKGGLVRLGQVCELLIREYRQGALGRVSLESPALIAKEIAAAEIEKAKKAQADREKAAHRAERARRRR